MKKDEEKRVLLEKLRIEKMKKDALEEAQKEIDQERLKKKELDVQVRTRMKLGLDPIDPSYKILTAKQPTADVFDLGSFVQISHR